jgi:hypothetical protein
MSQSTCVSNTRTATSTLSFESVRGVGCIQRWLNTAKRSFMLATPPSTIYHRDPVQWIQGASEREWSAEIRVKGFGEARLQVPLYFIQDVLGCASKDNCARFRVFTFDNVCPELVPNFFHLHPTLPLSPHCSIDVQPLFRCFNPAASLLTSPMRTKNCLVPSNRDALYVAIHPATIYCSQ